MDVFNHFSCHTKLPVRLSDVIEHIAETNVVAKINVYSLDIDVSFLTGFCWAYLHKPRNSVNHRKIAHIGYARALPSEMARLVICKELLHLLDDHHETAQTREQVETLLDEIVLPPAAAMQLPTSSDNNGVLLALAVMLPRDAIDEFRPKVAAGELSIETVARLAQLPEAFVRIAFTPIWSKVLDGFSQRYPRPEETLPGIISAAPLPSKPKLNGKQPGMPVDNAAPNDS